MLHTLLAYIRGLGIDTRWFVVSAEPDFFAVTKRLHNNIYGYPGDGGPLGPAEREIYERTLTPNIIEMLPLARRDDVVLLHDPQTAGMTCRAAGLTSATGRRRASDLHPVSW